MSRKSPPKNYSYHRKASHAGSWYSDDGEELHEQLGKWLENVDTKNLSFPPLSSKHKSENLPRFRAIIAPHAGLSYSGPTAAYAYAHLDPIHVKRIFVLGPSHHVYLDGCAVSVASHLVTPLGDLKVDEQITDDLLGTGKFQTISQDVDEDEHSIEMHLPFVKRRMGTRAFTVVAIMVGSTTEESDREYGSILAPYLSDPSNFFIVSSDFCHWGAKFRFQPHDKKHGAVHEYIKWLDHLGIGFLESNDIDGFYSYLEEHQNTICGRHPICTFLQAIRYASAETSSGSVGSTPFSITFVKYDQSSKCKGKRDSSVSYASAVISHN